MAFTLLLALLGGILLLRRGLLRGRDLRHGPTWDCGYIAPTARIQYTYSSFAQPLADMFRALTGSFGQATRPWGFSPRARATLPRRKTASSRAFWRSSAIWTTG
jgi:hydrogenase-4 component B